MYEIYIPWENKRIRGDHGITQVKETQEGVYTCSESKEPEIGSSNESQQAQDQDHESASTTNVSAPYVSLLNYV